MPTPLVLYKLDEAASGSAPTTAVDSAAGTPLNLSTGGATWVSIGAGRGLFNNGSYALVSANVNGTKVQAGLTTKATFEIVTAVTGGDYGRLLSLESSTHTAFQLDYSGSDLQITVNGAVVGTFPAGAAGVRVIHVCVDTTQATAGNRVKAYVDGAGATISGYTAPTLNAALAGLTDADCAIVQYYIPGTIYYAALYAAQLSAGEAAANSAALLANNDADPNGGGPTPDNPPVGRPRRNLTQVLASIAAVPDLLRDYLPSKVVQGLNSGDTKPIPSWPARLDMIQNVGSTWEAPTPDRQPARHVPQITVAAPDAPPVGWPARVARMLSRFLWEPEYQRDPDLRHQVQPGTDPAAPDAPPGGRTGLTESIQSSWEAPPPFVVVRRFAPLPSASDPPLGWPARALNAVLRALGAAEEPVQQQRKIPPAAPAPAPDAPPGGNHRVTRMAEIGAAWEPTWPDRERARKRPVPTASPDAPPVGWNRRILISAVAEAWEPAFLLFRRAQRAIFPGSVSTPLIPPLFAVFDDYSTTLEVDDVALTVLVDDVTLTVEEQ